MTTSLIDITLAKINAQKNVPVLPVSKRKHTILYDAGIVSGTTIAGGGTAAWATTHNFKKNARPNFIVFAKQQIKDFIEKSAPRYKSSPGRYLHLLKLREKSLAAIPIKNLDADELDYLMQVNQYKQERMKIQMTFLDKFTKELTSSITTKTLLGILLGAAVGATIVGAKYYYNAKKEGE